MSEVHLQKRTDTTQNSFSACETVERSLFRAVFRDPYLLILQLLS